MTVEGRDLQPTFRVHDPDAGVYVVFMDGRQIGLVQKHETWQATRRGNRVYWTAAERNLRFPIKAQFDTRKAAALALVNR
ncbi:Uncharacterised protein [Mycobacteroides abscessus subsp. abscessus]|uniref:hypothetical protein n=1 Tax=Mycobacteroides abscessus TaxID=36809 RepID=UPI00092BC430|nr:hypothetical protein [Mycobacteroides abscessus]SIH19555.1 Uncharacterised protein [Mycobacteroides abscessus subsp. abscessus]